MIVHFKTVRRKTNNAWHSLGIRKSGMIFRYCCGLGGQEKGMKKLENVPTLLTAQRFAKQRIATGNSARGHFVHIVKLTNGDSGRVKGWSGVTTL